MAVRLPRGFRAGATRAGIKPSGKPDLALLVSGLPASWAYVATQNRAAAPSIHRGRALYAQGGALWAVVVNAGNANCATGERGFLDDRRMAEVAALRLGVPVEEVLTASTGVIGVPLPVEKVETGLPQIELTPYADAFAEAILTTDLVPKVAEAEVEGARIVGIAKGSGMIHPNMATMLGFIATDAAITKAKLNPIVKKVVDWTFNNVTVDGDTSTNDMVLVLANGASKVKVETKQDLELFTQALFTVCNDLCAKIAEDGEGATKRVEINVTGARTYPEAKKAAKAIANSNLVKCALFGNDPNWGRILCAIGYSGAEFSKEKIDVRLCGMSVCTAMRPVKFPIPKMRKLMAKKIVAIDVDLGMGGESCAVAHTCDLTYDYVKINAEYHT